MFRLRVLHRAEYAVFDESHFPEFAILRREWNTFRDEALALRDDSRIKASGEYDDIGFNSFFRKGWKRFCLKWYDRPHPSALAHRPRSLAILSKIPSVKAAMLAQLPPGASSGCIAIRTPGRCAITSGSRRRTTPNDDECAIVVDGDPYAWRDGEAVMFDETYLHWAENRTDQDRIILFRDIERPMRYRWAQAVNGAIGGARMRAAASPNETGDRTGGLNRLFRYLYAIRRIGKRMTAWTRTAYYVVEWALFGRLLVAIPWR